MLKDEIQEQLSSIQQLNKTLKKIDADLEKEIAKRAQASILEDFYMASEKIFKLIASEIDQDLPEGEQWPKDLLRQMSVNLPETRPQVINKEFFHRMEEYLRFRHLVHNIYGFQLDYDRFNNLIEELPGTINQLEQQITQFLEQYEKIISED